MYRQRGLSRLLASNRSLDLVAVLLLDLVQKGLPITKESRAFFGIEHKRAFASDAVAGGM